jgi:hypothetical protein
MYENKSLHGPEYCQPLLHIIPPWIVISHTRSTYSIYIIDIIIIIITNSSKHISLQLMIIVI